MLKRIEESRIAQWVIAYLAGSWVLLQVLEFLWEVFELPLALLQTTLIIVGIGLLIVIVVAWSSGGKSKADTSSSKPVRKQARFYPFASLIIAVGLISFITVSVRQALQQQWARGEAILEARAYSDNSQDAEALTVLQTALNYLPDNEDLIALLDEVSYVPVLNTDPPGAIVFVRDYEAQQDWVNLGTTPLSDAVRIPSGLMRWRIEKEGYVNLEVIGDAWGPSFRIPGMVGPAITLIEGTEIPENMVAVPGMTDLTFITGIDPLSQRELDPFFIDKTEVTNSEYQEFVAAGAYASPQYWTQPFLMNGEEIPYEEAMTQFVDLTGQPGPAGWQIGRFNPGEENLPVSGVSWYEAVAYAEFRSKSLPTIHHWTAAAGPNFASEIVPKSNFGTEGPIQVGQTEGSSRWGALDMAGNVREWLWNESRGMRHNLGGAWSDNNYLFTFANVQSPWDRLPVNGFRLVQHLEEPDISDPLWGEEPLLSRDYAEEIPVSDEIFNVYRSQFEYDPAPLNVQVISESVLPYGRLEYVSFEGVGWGRIRAQVVIPENASPPYQTVIVFPGSAAIATPNEEDYPGLDYTANLIRSGKVIVMPILRGTFSRQDGLLSTWPNETRTYVDYVRSWVSEFSRTIDYLESRQDIDLDSLIYFGFSWGGRMGAIIPAVEPRLDAAIIWSGGLASGTALPEVDQINYITRVTIPVLMLNGPYDSIEPVEEAQLPMLGMFGTTPEHKKRVEIPGAGHTLPQIPVTRESLLFMDKYFGSP